MAKRVFTPDEGTMLFERLKAVLDNDGMGCQVAKIDGCNFCGCDVPPGHHDKNCPWLSAQKLMESLR
jgi:hypothetical protein